MKVKEMIARLEQLNPEAECLYFNEDHMDFYILDEVGYYHCDDITDDVHYESHDYVEFNSHCTEPITNQLPGY